jgi:hypothetical protein
MPILSTFQPRNKLRSLKRELNNITIKQRVTITSNTTYNNTYKAGNNNTTEQTNETKRIKIDTKQIEINSTSIVGIKQKSRLKQQKKGV